MNVAFITNIPAPYREQIHELVAAHQGINYQVYYCAILEPNRQWKFTLGNYKKKFLNSALMNIDGNAVYLGWGIYKELNLQKPNVVITGGFSAPMLLAFIWAKLHGSHHIAFSDSHPSHELHLSPFHRLLRHIVYPLSDAFLGPSIKTRSLYLKYSRKVHFFQTHLCADNAYYSQFITPLKKREYDILFCGRICIEKKYDFFVEVAKLVDIQRPIRVLIVGDGPDRLQLETMLKEQGISVDFTGFVTQDQLPEYYANAKILLFPTERDAWGIVANEALAVGTPVITCLEAGVAEELVVDDNNGYVLPLDASQWADRCVEILSNPVLWARLSAAALQSVTPYTYDQAAKGIIDAATFASSNKP